MNTLTKREVKKLIGKRVWFKANPAEHFPREALFIDGISTRYPDMVDFHDENGGGGEAYISDIEIVNGEPHIARPLSRAKQDELDKLMAEIF